MKKSIRSILAAGREKGSLSWLGMLAERWHQKLAAWLNRKTEGLPHRAMGALMAAFLLGGAAFFGLLILRSLEPSAQEVPAPKGATQYKLPYIHAEEHTKDSGLPVHGRQAADTVSRKQARKSGHDSMGAIINNPITKKKQDGKPN